MPIFALRPTLQVWVCLAMMGHAKHIAKQSMLLVVDESILPVDTDDRRFCLFEVCPRQFGSFEDKDQYFKALMEERDNGLHPQSKTNRELAG